MSQNEPDGAGGDHPVRGAKLVIAVIDDDRFIREGIRELFEGEGYAVESYENCALFLKGFRPEGVSCLLVDDYLPGIDGIGLLEILKRSGRAIPTIVITGSGDVSTAVAAMKAGALDYIQKPVSSVKLFDAVASAVAQSAAAACHRTDHASATVTIARLTPRQQEVMDLVLAGHPSKNIASDLCISQRTVENHRASIMKRTGSASLPALARLAVAAGPRHGDRPLG